MDPALSQRERPSNSPALLDCAAGLGIGVVIGVATSLGQALVPGQWNTLVNSGAIWLVAPFLMGSRIGSHRFAAVVGAITMLATVAGYYVTAALRGAPMSMWMTAFWLGVAIVAGPLYGLAGRWSHDDRRALRVIGVALLGGVFIAEAVYLIGILGYFWSGGVMLAAGLVAAAVLARRADRVPTLAALPAPALAAGLVYVLLNWLMQFRSV